MRPSTTKLSGAELTARAQAASSGDREAAGEILEAVADDVYELALRMLGHPADAEDAAQEILVIVLTHLGSFRGESALSTWVWRIAVNHLSRVRRGRRETVTFEILGERLQTGLRHEPSGRPDPEAAALINELRQRCTEAMVLSLDRELRVAHVLGDLFGLPGSLCAEILEIDAATFRKRLSRARQQLQRFVGGWCGLVDDANPCRCAGQVEGAIGRGLLAADDLYFTGSPRRALPVWVERAAEEVGELVQLAEVLRGSAGFAAPGSLVSSVRALLGSQRLEVLRP